jgi:hypothetical protein
MARAALSLGLLALLAASALAAPSVCVGRPGANGWSRLSPQAIKTSAVRIGPHSSAGASRRGRGRGRGRLTPDAQPPAPPRPLAGDPGRRLVRAAETISNYCAPACKTSKPAIVKTWCAHGRRGRAPPAAASKFAPRGFAPSPPPRRHRIPAETQHQQRVDRVRGPGRDSACDLARRTFVREISETIGAAP